MQHNDARGWGAITNYILKLLFMYSICFSYNYLIVNRRRSFINKESSRKIYEIIQKLKLWAGVPIAVSSCSAAAHMYR